MKHLLGCSHLLSTKRQGVETPVYCAIIAGMLMLLCTGRTPTKQTFEMICFCTGGVGMQAELELTG
jgi:hypothetical protein